MPNSNCLTIDQSALKANLNQLRKQLPDQGKLMIMVKGNGYGIGAYALSKELLAYGVEMLGVSHVDEGVALRQKGIQGEIFVLSTPFYEMEKAIAYDLQVALSSSEDALALHQQAKKMGKKIKVHLHIDTGMKRFGCDKQESLELYHVITHLSHLQLEGIMSHFFASSNPDFDSLSQEQINAFVATLQKIPSHPPLIHLSCSSALRRFSVPKQNMARIGLALFGLNTSEKDQELCPLQPALRLTSRLHALQKCPQGAGIGYFHSAIMEHKKGKLGIIPFGYHDGMPTSLSKEAYVRVRGIKAPIVGRVCMDFTLLDLSEVPDAEIGDEVTLFDQHDRPEQLAYWANMNVRALLCRLGERMDRKFVDYDKQSSALLQQAHATL